MAENKKQKSNNAPSKVLAVISFLKDERIKYIMGGTLVLFSFYMLMAFISYLFTWKLDNIDWIQVFSDSDIVVDNWAGKVGAALANKFLHNWFGIPSFGFIFLFAIIGLRLFGLKLMSIRKTIKLTIISIYITLVTH